MRQIHVCAWLLVTSLAASACSGDKFTADEQSSAPSETTGDAEWFARSKAEKIAGAEKLGLSVNPAWEEFEITNEIFSKKIEPTLIQPTFVTHLPKELCPLAKITVQFNQFAIRAFGFSMAAGRSRIGSKT